MFTNRLLNIFCVFFIVFMVGETMQAQSTRTRKERTTTTKKKERTSSRTRTARTTRQEDAADKDPYEGTWLGFSLGNLGFNRGFSASAKVSYGYNINKLFGAGVNAKFFFDNYNLVGPDINLFTYGAAAFARLNITDEIFLQGEYGRTKFEINRDQYETHTYPSVGGGYKSGFGQWSYGLHLLVPLKERPRDILNIEYWIDFNYKF